jgi:TRAP-type C4-dicarboxylate transport system permease small subunit
MLSLLHLVDRLLMRTVMVVATALLVLASSVSLWQVITRFALGDPSTWSEVASRSLIIWMVYLGMAVALRTGSLMTVELLLDISQGTRRKILIAIVAGLCLGVLLVMAWTGWEMAHRVRFQKIAGVVDPFTGGRISISWLYAALPVGAVLAIVGLAARTTELFRQTSGGGR